jgi:Flp pilus assembly protein TadG
MKRLRVLRGQRGQSLVEFSLVAIVFFIIVLGMIDATRAVWNYNTLAEATREGTRYAIVHGSKSTDPSGPGSSHYTAPSTDTKVAQTVQKFGADLSSSKLTVQSQWIDGTNAAGKRVKVTSSYQFTPFFSFAGLGSLAFTMTSSSTMTITY